MMKELKKGQQGKGLHTYILNGLMGIISVITLVTNPAINAFLLGHSLTVYLFTVSFLICSGVFIRRAKQAALLRSITSATMALITASLSCFLQSQHLFRQTFATVSSEHPLTWIGFFTHGWVKNIYFLIPFSLVTMITACTMGITTKFSKKFPKVGLFWTITIQRVLNILTPLLLFLKPSFFLVSIFFFLQLAQHADIINELGITIKEKYQEYKNQKFFMHPLFQDQSNKNACGLANTLLTNILTALTSTYLLIETFFWLTTRFLSRIITGKLTLTQTSILQQLKFIAPVAIPAVIVTVPILCVYIKTRSSHENSARLTH
ncbi:hypothetical protein MMH89_02030 [Candidatus Comchoanobacter bicostacola]|uniref:Uncharacterized protein n=1 Tax=Candidatus Comchoanobacter bicostacola TaxID=2919598 RepID=A0ABY5DMT6_9GAMM|nr:hypothetical protein [Candidatus Comchoanobacter bicostacola]UTC24927.1 hypothetical protein MMH89_02030 [Candidatus Comchoanobacter bicostacola]